MSILYVGIDLAKNVFAVDGVDESGTARLRQPKLATASQIAAASAASFLPCLPLMR